MSPLGYFLTQTRVVYTYLRLLVFPYPQSLEYEFANAGGVLTILGIAVILGAAWWFRKSIPGLCVLAFFILLAPTSSIVPSADAAFEHRLYLPMLAFSLLAAYLVSHAPRRTWIAASLILVLGVLTVRRGTVWSSDVALWEDAVKHAPGKARAWFNLGGAYLQSDPDKARAALLRAIELQPHLPAAHYDLGIVEQGKSNWSMALAYYGRAVEQDPSYWPAWNNMGNTLFSMGQRERSLEYFEKTLSLNRDYWPAQYNIAIVHVMSGRYAEALPRLKTVLDWQPDFREARQLLASTLTLAGYRASAEAEMKKLGELHAAESRNTPTMILAPNRP
jgi:tetratricopeptide (TPR) repeat protein